MQRKQQVWVAIWGVALALVLVVGAEAGAQSGPPGEQPGGPSTGTPKDGGQTETPGKGDPDNGASEPRSFWDWLISFLTRLLEVLEEFFGGSDTTPTPSPTPTPEPTTP